MPRREQKSIGDRPSRHEQQRDRILNQAIKTASAQGLEALTIGRMAASMGMSKSGLFAHFGSKRNLQEATIDRAKEIFDQGVLQPVEKSVGGIGRLWSLCDLWLRHLENRVFPSGYFFTGAFLEYGERSGPLVSRLREAAKIWMEAIERSVGQAQNRKDLKAGLSGRRIAFELNAVLIGAYWAHLAGYGAAFSDARIIILGRVKNWATDKIPSRALSSVSRWSRYLRARAKRNSGE